MSEKWRLPSSCFTANNFTYWTVTTSAPGVFMTFSQGYKFQFCQQTPKTSLHEIHSVLYRGMIEKVDLVIQSNGVFSKYFTV